MDKEFKATFTRCPNCGSTDRFFEQMAQELKDRGLARPEWNFHYDVRNGVVADQQKMQLNQVPIGSELPGYVIQTDVCMQCGTVYAVELLRLQAKVSLPPTAPMPPMNRAMRRRIEKEGGNLSGPIFTS